MSSARRSDGRLEKVLFDVAGEIRVVAMCSWRSEKCVPKASVRWLQVESSMKHDVGKRCVQSGSEQYWPVRRRDEACYTE